MGCMVFRALPFLAATAILAVWILGGGCLNTQPKSITVEGRVKGNNGNYQPLPDFTMSLSHTAAGTEPHLVFKSEPGMLQDIKQVTLSATASTGLPFNESWHFICITHPGQRPGANPAIVEFSQEPGFVDRNVGEIAWLRIRKNDVHLPSDSFSNFASASIRGGGTCLLARVEDDDFVLPWHRAQGTALENMPLSATLRSLADAGGSDPFDMQSLTSTLLNNIAVIAADAAQDHSARITEHRIAVVPHMPSTSDGNHDSLPGICFIYEGSMETALGHLTLSVPLTINWFRDATGTLTVTLDPLGAPALGQIQVNDKRVTVTSTDADFIHNFGESIRQSVSNAITMATMPTGPGGIPITSFLALLFTESTIRPSGGLPSNFSLLAIPEDETVSGAPSNVAMKMGEITVTDLTLPVAGGLPCGIGAAGAVPGGRGARVICATGGGVTVFQNKNAAGTQVHRFDLPLPADVLPFKLVLLK
jgi:hypothetical protein